MAVENPETPQRKTEVPRTKEHMGYHAVLRKGAEAIAAETEDMDIRIFRNALSDKLFVVPSRERHKYLAYVEDEIRDIFSQLRPDGYFHIVQYAVSQGVDSVFIFATCQTPDRSGALKEEDIIFSIQLTGLHEFRTGAPREREWRPREEDKPYEEAELSKEEAEKEAMKERFTMEFLPKFEEADFHAELQQMMVDYLLDWYEGEERDALRQHLEKDIRMGKLFAIGASIESMMDVYLQNNEDLAKSFKAGDLTTTDLVRIVFDDMFIHNEDNPRAERMHREISGWIDDLEA